MVSYLLLLVLLESIMILVKWTDTHSFWTVSIDYSPTI